ncbi:hypothetical protein [Streptomyces armeniacus]|uniref:hypothetical protein n=1 Tax=Streptomyces armeniacus TaxID=83291 RepID=UPI001C9A9513|nr:hypothetical protein [Streptomyces armeniacus]
MADQALGHEKAGRARGHVTAEDMSRVTETDFTEMGELARRYCRVVDSTRSRKRANRCATIVKSGHAPYGTDDVSDDVTQDAVLIFAKRLGEIVTSCDVSAVWVETCEPCAWQYVRRDGGVIIVSRKTVQRWAVRDAAARNGYRLDVQPEEVDSVPGAQVMRGMPHVSTLPALAVTPYLADYSREIFRSAWGDGSDFPTIKQIIDIANTVDDLGRGGVFGKAAQSLYGGPRNSSWKVQQTRDAARKEWRKLKGDLDTVREDMVYRSTRPDQSR